MECFVCMEPCARACRCQCVNLMWHVECQRRLIQTTGATQCAICKQDIGGVVVTQGGGTRLTPRLRNTTVLLLLALLMLVFGAVLVGLFLRGQRNDLGISGGCLLALGIIGTTLSCSFLCCTSQMLLQLPAPLLTVRIRE